MTRPLHLLEGKNNKFFKFYFVVFFLLSLPPSLSSSLSPLVLSVSSGKKEGGEGESDSTAQIVFTDVKINLTIRKVLIVLIMSQFTIDYSPVTLYCFLSLPLSLSVSLPSPPSLSPLSSLLSLSLSYTIRSVSLSVSWMVEVVRVCSSHLPSTTQQLKSMTGTGMLRGKCTLKTLKYLIM